MKSREVMLERNVNIEEEQLGLTLKFLSYKILEYSIQNKFRISQKNTPCLAKLVFRETETLQILLVEQKNTIPQL